MQELDRGVYRLRALSYLDISYNRLTTLEGIDKLANLRYLDASHNRLVELDEDMTSSLMQLEHLDMSFNCVSTLPQHFGVLSQLRLLDLSHNRVTELPNQRLDVLANVQVIVSACGRASAVGRPSIIHRGQFFCLNTWASSHNSRPLAQSRH